MQAPQGEIDNLYLWFGAHHTNDLMGVVVTFSIPRLYDTVSAVRHCRTSIMLEELMRLSYFQLHIEFPAQISAVLGT